VVKRKAVWVVEPVAAGWQGRVKEKYEKEGSGGGGTSKSQETTESKGNVMRKPEKEKPKTRTEGATNRLERAYGRGNKVVGNY